MKKIILLFVFSIYLGNVFGQQQVNFVNNSDYDIFISYIATTEQNDMTGTQEPQLVSITSDFVVPAGTIYSAEEDNNIPNTYKFPYNEFNSLNGFAGISHWNESGTLITSNQAYNLHGATQKFYYAKVVVEDPSIGDGGNIGQNFGNAQSFISGTYVNYFFSEFRPDPSDPTYIIYNILIL